MEQVDRLFMIKHEAGKDMSWSEIARTEIPVRFGTDAGNIAAEVQHCENVA